MYSSIKIGSLAIYSLAIISSYFTSSVAQSDFFSDRSRGFINPRRGSNVFGKRESTTTTAPQADGFRNFDNFFNRRSPAASRRSPFANRRRSSLTVPSTTTTRTTTTRPTTTRSLFQSLLDTTTQRPIPTVTQSLSFKSLLDGFSGSASSASPSTTLRVRVDSRRPPPPSPEKITELRREANTFISEDDEWLPNLVQLTFHTCVGGCDGCLNLEEKDNKGLIPTYASIKSLWRDRFQALTLADFIVLMGTEAAEIAMGKPDADIGVPPPIDFHTGRVTCPDPDNYHLDFHFPQGDAQDPIEFLMNEFNYKDRKMAIALLGAHSLGACRKEHSGFAGRWDNSPLVLDNHYYKSLADSNLWLAVPTVNGESFQWNSTTENGPIMLHSDMSLLINFNVDQDKRPSCMRSTDCHNTKDASRVSVYAASGNLWARDFVKAFIQMCEKGRVR